MNRWLPLVLAAGASVACGKVVNSQDPTASGDGDRQDGGPAVDSGGFPPGDARASGGPSGGSNSGGAGGGTGTGALHGSGGSGESGSGEGGSGAGGVAGSAASEEGGTIPNDPPPGVPQELFEQPTVWIGEVERAVTYPPPADLEAPQRVVLVLDAVNGSVTGSIMFGSGPPVTTAIGSPPPDSSVDEEYLDLNVNWLSWPYPRFEYPVGPSDLRGNRLALSFVPGHLFGDWCALQVRESGVAGWCVCEDDACGPPDHPVRRFDLVVTDDTMEGELSQPAGNWLVEPPAIRLKRVQ